MQKQTFLESLKPLITAFNGGKDLTPDQTVMLYKEVRHIPKEAFDWIINQRLKAKKWRYGNFPTVDDICKGYWLWQKENPEKIVRRQLVPCDECEGTGMIYYKYQDPLYVGMFLSETFAYCSKCDNYLYYTGGNPENKALKWQGRANREQLRAEGYEPLPRPKVIGKPSMSIKEAANIATKSVDTLPTEKDKHDKLQELQNQAEEIKKKEWQPEDDIPF
jgi:hypothetical protein